MDHSSSPPCPDGHALGGGASRPLTPAQLRQRRLASLEQRGTPPKSQSADNSSFVSADTTSTPQGQSTPVPTTSSSPEALSPPNPPRSAFPPTVPTSRTDDQIDAFDQPATASPSSDTTANTASTSAGDTNTTDTASSVGFVVPDNNVNDDYDHDDEDLQKALALSLAGDTDEEEEDDDGDVAMIDISQVGSSNPPPPPFTFVPRTPDQLSFQVQEWYQNEQPCNILDFHYIMWDVDGVTTPNDQRRWLSQGIHFKITQDDQHQARYSQQDSLLAAIIANYGVWGLTQAHGGPCGVLASIQAELLRLLLFGPRNDDHTLEFPTQLTNHFVRSAPDLSHSFLRQALALAISMTLARASMAPSATYNDHLEEPQQQQHSNEDVGVATAAPAVVHLIMPKPSHRTDLQWDHLEPWTADQNVGSGLSEHLVVYRISLPEATTSSNRDSSNIDNASPSQKRPKREWRQVEDLAHATAKFLLETNLLDWFGRPGGVLLLVLSLATSRGIPNIQGDMDDPTVKLTSNFGHCSQELINLLLTGQAVSNVFDNTLRPSGALICRGIQSRPTIGYLSQLESMRYLEVGGYYKTPQFPIWVVGSTSHFTVMFGDAACLKESQADSLLEKVRRAFKQMDGGEENGFIQTQQLDPFLKSLDLNLNEHGVQTLAATLEVHGAGIILWEDLWKRVSRLLTGASLEAVLEWTDPPASSAATSSNNNGVASSPLQPQDSALSDEELARKLQAEWNGEVIDLTGTPAAMTVAASPNPQQGTNSENNQKEKYGPTFQLYHYNGLRGGSMKPFRVTRLSADEAIGASVSLGVSSHSSAHSAVSTGDLEDVVRTKWPSSKIDWLGGPPPSID